MAGRKLPIDTTGVEDVFSYLLTRNEGIRVPGLPFRYPTGYLTNGTQTPVNDGSATLVGPVTLGGIITPCDQVWRVEAINGNCTRDILLYCQAVEGNIYGSAQAGGAMYFGIVGPNRHLAISPKRVLAPSTTLGHQFYGCLDTTAGKWAYFGGYDLVGVTNDFDIHADKVILLISDSIGRGTMATTYNRDDLYIFKLKNWLWARGTKARVVNKSYSGQTSLMLEYMIKNGEVDIPQADLIVYSLGGNDVTAGGYGQQNIDDYAARLQLLIQKKKDRYPDAFLLFLGTTPHNDNTSESRLVVLRQAMSDAATAEQDGRTPNEARIGYCSTDGLFDRTNTANYYNADGKHPNTANHALIFDTAIKNYITDNAITI